GDVEHSSLGAVRGHNAKSLASATWHIRRQVENRSAVFSPARRELRSRAPRDVARLPVAPNPELPVLFGFDELCVDGYIVPTHIFDAAARAGTGFPLGGRGACLHERVLEVDPSDGVAVRPRERHGALPCVLLGSFDGRDVLTGTRRREGENRNERRVSSK